MNPDKSIMVQCECGGEAIEIQHWSDENKFYFSIWRCGFFRPMRWKERFRWCWYILRTGNPWADHIILHTDNAKQVAEFLTQNHIKNE
jgi:hypothetical protein